MKVTNTEKEVNSFIMKYGWKKFIKLIESKTVFSDRKNKYKKLLKKGN